ncbi:hypothetical protein ALC56_01815 [Trachymyrmex septentrionalis]|uniref:Uncharacterized protein n=1 Tax=Trachymyrmex septentrionalis TaxID=34720 RepID=A0A195FUJ7_9HYME|nr:hypothetical protein ALC56_01815 [Trachymyrmex septentrionalis]
MSNQPPAPDADEDRIPSSLISHSPRTIQERREREREREREKEREKAGQSGVAERAGKVAVQNRTEGIQSRTLPLEAETHRSTHKSGNKRKCRCHHKMLEKKQRSRKRLTFCQDLFDGDSVAAHDKHLPQVTVGFLRRVVDLGE